MPRRERKLTNQAGNHLLEVSSLTYSVISRSQTTQGQIGKEYLLFFYTLHHLSKEEVLTPPIAAGICTSKHIQESVAEANLRHANPGGTGGLAIPGFGGEEA